MIKQISILICLILVNIASAGELRTMPDVEGLRVSDVQLLKSNAKFGVALSASEIDQKFALGWALISKAERTETGQIEEGLSLWRDIPGVQTRLHEVLRIESDEQLEQQSHRWRLLATLSKTRSKFAVEFLISLLDDCTTPPNSPIYPGRDYGSPPALCLLAAENLNLMELPGAPYNPVQTPQVAEIQTFKANWQAWYQQNKNTLID